MAIEPELTAIEPDLLDTPAAGPAAIRGGLVRVIGYCAGILLSLVSIPLLIRHLGVRDYGRYVIAISLVAIVQGITDVGLGQIGVREFATRAGAERDQLMRNLLGVRTMLTGAGVALAVVFAGVASYGNTLVLGTLLTGAAMVITVVQGTFAVPLAAGLRLGWVTAIDLLRQALTVAGIVALVLAGSRLLPFLALTVPVAVIVLGATVILVRGTMPLRPSFQITQWRPLLRAVLPFTAAVVIGTLYLRITVILTSLLADAAQTGYYATSYRVLEVLIAIPAVTVGSTLPILARAARDDRQRLSYVLQRLFDVMLILGAWLALAVFLGAGFAIDVLAGGKAAPAVVVLQIQSLAILTQFVSTSWQYGLLSLHRHRALLVISATGLVVSVVLTVILVPLIDARGAAIAFAGGELAVAAGSLMLLRRSHANLSLSLTVPVRVLAAAALAIGVLLIPGLTSLVRAIVASVIYFGVLVALRGIPPELLQAILRRPQPL